MAVIFIPCQTAFPSVCVGTGLIPSTEGTAAAVLVVPILMPAMLDPPDPALDPALDAAVELDVEVVLSAAAQPPSSTPATMIAAARRPR
jgi:hypothetical protein